MVPIERVADIDADFNTDDDSRLCYLNTIKSYILINFAYRLLQYMTLASNRGVGRVHTTHSYCVVSTWVHTENPYLRLNPPLCFFTVATIIISVK